MRNSVMEMLKKPNLASFNINKLDLKYDIDLLFHKMLKKFDEGGANLSWKYFTAYFTGSA